MSSLQEQLLKAGLVDEKKLQQAESQKRKAGKQARHGSGKKAAKKKAAPSAAQKQQEARARRDRELNAKRAEAMEQKAIAAQVRQLVDQNKVDRSKGEIPFSFVYNRKVKKIYIGETEKNLLQAGNLAIVTLVINHEGRRFELVPTDVAAKIAERDPEAVITLQRDDDGGDGDDPYADYKIPDDLVW